MSQVKMTGDFASAMVTVVPVTLLIAVVEVTRYYAIFAQASVKEKEEFRTAAQLALENPIQMRGIFIYRRERKSAADTFSFMYRLYAAIMATVLVPLIVVEVLLVRWLSQTDPPDSHALAMATWACTVWSFVIVGFLAPATHYHAEKAVSMWLKDALDYEVREYMRVVQDKLSAAGQQTYGEFLDERDEISRRIQADLEQLNQNSSGRTHQHGPET
ncbi:hypothetical protein [Streptomyces bluensis]|uniref:hypothetical protein n=1 Tax=Streptomyces bluensis TaxID=33897 RepID=UPI00331C6221